MQKKTTLGLIVANRGFFPDHLCQTGRETMLKVLADNNINVITLSEKETKFGSVESREDAARCAALFKKHADNIDGIIVSLPNFGDEAGIADALRLSGLKVPVLIQAFPDDVAHMSIKHRRDSFCGKMSACNNLGQYGIRFSLTTQHTVDPQSDTFRDDVQRFAATCRVVRALRNARIGAIGARPAAFKTVRYSEKLLEASGISVETIDLYDLFGQVDKISVTDKAVQAKLKAIKGYVGTRGVPATALKRMARFGVAVDRWVQDNALDATAVQCWTAMEEFFGVVPCTVMSMLSEALLPSACEVDVTGAIGMLALARAANRPAALLDWNNNFGDDPDMCVLFHCSNLPKSMFREVTMDYQAIIAGTVGKGKTFGTCVGPIRSGPFSFVRVSTDDTLGQIRAYTGQGIFADTPLTTFGGYGPARIPELQKLLAYICRHGFEHHVAVTHAQVAGAIDDAMGTYLDWDVYRHS